MTFENKPIHFVAGVIGYLNFYYGSRAFVYAFAALSAIYSTGLLTPNIMNGYFTWKFGHSVDKLFAANCGTIFGEEIAKQIIKETVHFPTTKDFLEFWNETKNEINSSINLLNQVKTIIT